MIIPRPAAARGHTAIGWLDSHHTFSFGDYYDAAHMGFSSLRVINDDRVAAGAGFGTHPHRDMEIVSYVLEGALEHRDSMGNGSVIRRGDVQRMSAGTGVTHSEFNASKTDPVHFLQIWILPSQRGLPSGYEQRPIPEEARKGRFALLASSAGRDGSVTIHQDASIWGALIDAGQSVPLRVEVGRRVWVHVAEGSLALGGVELDEGAGAAVTHQSELVFVGGATGANVLAFDLA
jgi:redox-sensitive bicupin YhaK (pirin superfamily)